MRPPAAPPCLSPGKRVKMVLNKEISAAEPRPKLFEVWSRNYLFNKYLLQSVWRMLGFKNK